MADNVTANAGSGGSVFASDDIGGVQYPRSKVVWGPDGTANDTDVASGKSLPVQVRLADGTAVSPALEGGNLATAVASLSVLDDWDETDRAKVNIIAGQAGIAAGTGVDGATVPRVSLATNVGLPAGTSILGKVGIDQTTPGTTNAVAATNLPTTVDTNSGVKSASTLRVVLATDQPALTNKLLVTPDSVALPANQSVNVSQINAVTPLMGSGNTGTGSLRVTIATDQAQLTNKLLVTPDANSAVNVAQMNGVATSMGSGANGTGVQRVTLATDDTIIGLVTETAPTTDTASSGLNGRAQRIAQRLTSLISPGLSISVTVTRPSDTIAYAANDILGPTGGGTAGIDFNIGAISGSNIAITSVALERDVTALISGETSYNLYLYNVTPPSANADNVAFDLPSGDRASFLGKINLGTPVDEGSTLYIEQNSGNGNLPKQVKLSGTHIFGYLVTVGAYTPASATVLKITLNAVQL